MIFFAEYRVNLPIQNITTVSISEYYLLLYLPLLPQLVFFYLHFLRFINAFLLTREITKTDPAFLINDPLPLANGSQIEHVLIDKTGIISQKDVKFDEFLTQEAYFTLDFHSKPSTQARKLFKNFHAQKPSKEEIEDLEEHKDSLSLDVYNHFSDMKNPSPNISIKLPVIEEELLDPESPTPRIRGGLLKLVYAPQDTVNDPQIFTFNEKATNILQPMNIPYKCQEDESAPEEILDEKSFKNAIRERVFGVHEALLSILICSQMRVSRETEGHQSDRTSILDNCYSDEINLLKLCQDHNYFFLNKSKDSENRTMYLLQIKGTLLKFYIGGINDYTHERGRYSLVTYDPNKLEEGGILYVKGLAHKMTGILKVNKRKRLVEEVITEGEKTGKQYLIYATKHLNKVELLTYLKRYGALKTNLIKKTEEQNKFFNSLECDLQHLAVISIENSLQEGVKESIDTFHKLGFKIWLVSGDTYNRVLSTAYLSNIINPTTELWRITGGSLDEVEVSLKLILETLQDILKKKTNDKQTSFEPLTSQINVNIIPYYKTVKHFSSSIRGSTINDKKSISVNSNISLMISGEALDLILESPYLYYHFCFICNFCQVIIGFKIKPNQKSALIKLIRESDISRPLIMAIGNGYNDIQMLQESDFGVEMKGGDSNNSGLNAGDLVIGNWKVLNDIILVHSRNLSEKLEQCTYFQFYTSIVFGMTLLFLNAYNGFAGVVIYNPLTYFAYHYWANLVPVIVCMGFSSFLNPIKLKNNVILYKENILRKFKYIKNMITLAYVPGFWNSLFVILVLQANFEEMAMDNGMALGYKGFSLMLFIIIVAIGNMRVFLFYFKKLNNKICFS